MSSGDTYYNVFFSPNSIAIIGASEKPGIGRAIFSNIKNGYKGKIYPVTPTNEFVFGLKAFKNVLDIPEDIDLAVVATPNKIVPQVMEDVGKKKIKGAIIVSAGFKEVDEQGAKLEKEVSTICKKYGTRVIGPNCLGIMSLSKENMMNATFLKITPKYGGIALVSQSGAICAATVEDAMAQGIGFSKVISMGNKVDVDENDVLELLFRDSETKVIIMYLEDIHDGRRFMEIARKTTLDNKKPVVVLKAGRTPEGARAAMSHTGALMGPDEVYDALFAQSGVIRVDSMQELFDLATAFSKQPVPEYSKGVAIVSNAGGPAIISTDACSKYGIKIADLSSSRNVIAKVIPPHGSTRNPVDIVGDADFNRFEKVLREVVAAESVGSIVTMCTPSATLDYNELAKTIVKTTCDSGKTSLAALMGLAEGTENKQILSDGGVPHFPYAEPAIRTLKSIYDFSNWLGRPQFSTKQFEVNREKVKQIFENVRKSGRLNLLEEEGYEVLASYGFPRPKSSVGNTAEECIRLARETGYPIVMKIVSKDIIHKSDAGGVKVGLRSDKEVSAAFEEIMGNARKFKQDAKIEGVLVQQMIENAREIILGANHDPLFGPLIMFGLGGIYVEILKDVIFRLAPIDEYDALNMTKSIKTAKLLKAVRGKGPADINALVDSLLRLSQLILDFPEIEEFDMNPLLVLEEGKGVCAVDVRIGLRKK
ncbi:MAG TPA: acetate--CoA ligase family protein [Nitrososphaeraceae archaeon]|jgi:4-hydroxybutyryl-CoA synthetase (ADP-forming)